MEKFILASVMLFSFISFSLGFSEEVVDRVIAYVDNYAITLKEFIVFSKKMKENFSDMKNEEILETMINRILLIKKAEEYFAGLPEEELINNYIELKIKSTIIISEDKVRNYYESNKDKFKNIPYISIREEIEKYLFEKELNKKLKEHIKELRESTEIKIIFIP
ncbi:MAG: hypothetical protein ABDH16_00285 [Thermodesulfovibrionaceae bacterium]